MDMQITSSFSSSSQSKPASYKILCLWSDRTAFLSSNEKHENMVKSEETSKKTFWTPPITLISFLDLLKPLFCFLQQPRHTSIPIRVPFLQQPSAYLYPILISLVSKVIQDQQNQFLLTEDQMYYKHTIANFRYALLMSEREEFRSIPRMP